MKQSNTVKHNAKSFREEVAAKLKQAAEQGNLYTWIKSWKGVAGPFNGCTKETYKKINNINLRLTADMNGWKDPRWYTMNQIKDVKGYYHKEHWHLKAGSKGTLVEYWAPYDVKNHKGLTWAEYHKAMEEGADSTDYTLFSKYYYVFNAECVEGVPAYVEETQEDIEPSEVVSILAEEMGVEIFDDGGDRAYYSPSQDSVHLPKTTAFFNTRAYNLTALHELCHATGHTSRLNRNQTGFFGTKDYAFEELVAEIAAVFSSYNINQEVEDKELDNHKAYIQSWSEVLKDEPNFFTKAISEASKAAEYIDSLLGKRLVLN